MGKIGDIFREARLGKGLTLEQVADETNISKRFLQGIESDDFSGFPGEVYTLGFIRNYAEFLVSIHQQWSSFIDRMRAQDNLRPINPKVLNPPRPLKIVKKEKH